MHKVIVRKYLNALNKVSCSCGYIVFATTGKEIDYLAMVHCQKHDKATVETYVENELEIPNPKRAKPGRHDGNNANPEGEGNYGYGS